MFQAFRNIKSFFRSHKKLNREKLSDFEEMLYASDIGVKTVQKIMSHLHATILKKKELTLDQIQAVCTEILLPPLRSLEKRLTLSESPTVIMMVGVNGVGKTTTLAKLAKIYHGMGKKILLVAADTFRAAAVQQLKTWGQRLGIDVFSGAEQSDPSAVIYDAMRVAKDKSMDVVIIDTAGRMHTDTPLMDELRKMKRVTQKVISNAPHEIWTVIDANTGYNALQQCKQFREALGVTGLIVTKLDGTAKGGILLTASEELAIPVVYLGLGEGVDDLKPFIATEYLERMFKKAFQEG